jgi:hypothetical protein
MLSVSFLSNENPVSCGALGVKETHEVEERE